MIRFYRYLFFRSYDLMKLTGNYDLAWGASHFLALFLGILNIKILNSSGIINNFEKEATIGLIFYLGIHLLNYFLILKQDKFKLIIFPYTQQNLIVLGFFRTFNNNYFIRYVDIFFILIQLPILRVFSELSSFYLKC